MYALSVVDLEAPNITCPGTVARNTSTDANQALNVSYPDIAAWDAVDGARAVSCVAGNLSSFGVGVSNVTCAASDASGNTGACWFLVNVTGPGVCSCGSVYGTISSEVARGVVCVQMRKRRP